MSTPPPEDPYKVLGVPKDATKEAIRSAHRKLVLRSHPDKIQDESLRVQKQDEFQRVQQAYELLSDEARRQQYDETVKLAERRRQLQEEVERAKASRRYESPRHSPREFDDRSKRVYEERVHTRSYEDERPRSYEDRSASKKYDTFEARRPARSFEDRDRKASRVEDDERAHAERERKREADRIQHSERRRTRDRERRRGHDDKQARVAAYHSDDDMAEAMNHIRITRESEKLRAESDKIRDEEDRRTAEKIHAAREYMDRARRASEDLLPRPLPNRSHTTYYTATAHPAPPPPPMPVEDSTIRRSAARRAEGGRERRRETSRPRSRGKDSRDIRPTTIVDPPSKTYERVKVITVPIPHLSTSTSSPTGLEIPASSSRSHHSHSRSSPAMAQAMKPQRAATTLETIRPRGDPIPSFSRSNTTPVVSTTPRKETVTSSGKLKEKVINRPLGEAGFDSGYSSAAPDSPYLGSGGRLSSSPTNRYTEYRSSSKSKVFPESKIYDEPEYAPRHRTVLRETDEEYNRSRSVSPSAPRPRRGSESSSRPRPSASTVEYASNGRPIQYVYPVEPSRVPPPPMRSQTLDTPSRRVVPEKVHYSPRIGKEDISYSPPYTTTRRTTSHGPPHYARPSYPRAETTYV